jgi:hypothetical protein
MQVPNARYLLVTTERVIGNVGDELTDPDDFTGSRLCASVTITQ